MEILVGYAKKCRIIRQIQSNKALKFKRINTAQNVATVTVASFLTFIGFSGLDKITIYVNWFVTVDKSVVELVFNLLVFLLFVLAILHLAFRFAEKQADSERAVVTLTNLLNYIEDTLSQANMGTQITQTQCEIVRQKYDTVIQVIPANTDSEFLSAKTDYKEKEAKQQPMQVVAIDLFDETKQRAMVESLIRNSEQVMGVLDALRSIDKRLYLAGGLVRNLVWDYLHGFKAATPIDDIDVFYFDKLSATKDHDIQKEQLLREKFPNLAWSVKNQVRMHIVNQEAPYESLEDAIRKVPETVTAIAIRLTDNGQIEAIAPFGYSDLFRLLVCPTPHFAAKIDKYRSRVIQKNWVNKWPKLKVEGMNNSEESSKDVETLQEGKSPNETVRKS